MFTVKVPFPDRGVTIKVAVLVLPGSMATAVLPLPINMSAALNASTAIVHAPTASEFWTAEYPVTSVCEKVDESGPIPEMSYDATSMSRGGTIVFAPISVVENVRISEPTCPGGVQLGQLIRRTDSAMKTGTDFLTTNLLCSIQNLVN